MMGRIGHVLLDQSRWCRIHKRLQIQQVIVRTNQESCLLTMIHGARDGAFVVLPLLGGLGDGKSICCVKDGVPIQGV
jgi:hypothetical protein